MRRFVLGCLALLVGMSGVFVYNGVAREREFQRLVAAGDQAIVDEHPFLAIEAYSGALALDPASMAAHLKRGETYQRQGDLLDARRDLSRAAVLDPGAPRPHERLGDVSFALEQHADAIEHYVRYLRLDDQNPRVLYKLAVAYERDGQMNRAVPRLRQAIRLDPEFVEAHYLLGLCLQEQNRLHEAQSALATAVDLSPGFLQARDALTEVHRARGEPRDELRQLDALAALDRAHPRRHVARGLAYARSGQTDMAVLALGRATEEHPDQPLAYTALGRVWLEIAETQADPVALNKAVDALLSIPGATASSEALTLLGRAHLLRGNLDSARHVLNLAVERFPVDPAAFLQLAWLEEGDRNWSVARQLRERHRLLTEPPAANAAGRAAQPRS